MSSAPSKGGCRDAGTCKLAFVAADGESAEQAHAALTTAYGDVTPEDADVIVALGGDGFMLEALHEYLHLNKPIYGMHRGTVGFLMNGYDEAALRDRVAAADLVELHPLRMTAKTADGDTIEALAINEVSMLRETRQAARLSISVDGRTRLEELVCDGVLVSTPAGSTAYNLSVHGPVLPVGADVLALTPISAFRPRRWRGAILPHTATVDVTVLEPDKRPVSAVADRTEAREVVSVTITEDRSITMTLLFDPDQSLDERILSEQFQP